MDYDRCEAIGGLGGNNPCQRGWGSYHFDGLQVSFQPQADRRDHLNPGPGSVGATDAEGRFTLRLSDPDRPGAVVAAHTVRMTMVREAAADLPDVGGPIDTTLPPQTRDGTLRFEVGREAPNVSR